MDNESSGDRSSLMITVLVNKFKPTVKNDCLNKENPSEIPLDEHNGQRIWVKFSAAVAVVHHFYSMQNPN